ncbi:MAG: alpha/beta hydrolase [Ruminococcaceae bacterium]|nr:alpha/beta hydrolase [Oscillospiraceae bacterium]
MITKRIPLWEGREDVALYTVLKECTPNPMVPTKPEALPAVVVCPGGAYMFCSMENEGDTVAFSFADAGYQTFILQYTVGTTCGENDSRHPAQLLDLAKALLIIRENAEAWHVDPQRIALIGFSAGANLCANMAVYWHTPLLSGRFDVPSEYFKPMAVMLGYPLTDYSYQEEYNATLPPNPMLLAGNKAVFGTPTPDKEQLDEMSPCLHVSEKTPPIFLFHAANDSLVPAVHSLKMALALAEKGIPYELHVFQNGEHGFATGVPNGVGPYRADKHQACSAWVELAKTWLMRWAAPETQEHDFCIADAIRSGSDAPPAAFCI